MKRRIALAAALVVSLLLCLTGCDLEGMAAQLGTASTTASYDLSDLPAYDGSPYVVLNDNQPAFTQEDMTTDSYETYSELDELGRCGWRGPT